MKTRVFLQGSIICVVIWVLVFAAQAYFRGMRSTAENLGKVVQDEEFLNLSASKEEPSGELARAREEKIREVAAIVGKLEVTEEAQRRRSALKDEFYAKLSPGERELFVALLLKPLDLQITLFDALSKERREKELKRAFGAAEEELPPAQLDRLNAVLGEKIREQIGIVGWRAAMEGKGPDEIMAYLQVLDIVGELLQRKRMPHRERRDRHE